MQFIQEKTLQKLVCIGDFKQSPILAATVLYTILPLDVENRVWPERPADGKHPLSCKLLQQFLNAIGGKKKKRGERSEEGMFLPSVSLYHSSAEGRMLWMVALRNHVNILMLLLNQLPPTTWATAPAIHIAWDPWYAVRWLVHMKSNSHSTAFYHCKGYSCSRNNYALLQYRHCQHTETVLDQPALL